MKTSSVKLMYFCFLLITLPLTGKSADMNISKVPAIHIEINNTKFDDFHEDVFDYNYSLPYSRSADPVVRAFTKDKNLSLEVEAQQESVDQKNYPASTIITVSSKNDSSIRKYRINYQIVPELDLFLCIGQSNMAGQAPLNSAKGDYNVVAGAYLMNKKNEFEPAKNGMNRYSNILSATTQYYGLSYSFAKKIVAHANVSPGFVVNARGGTTIQQWSVDGVGPGDTLFAKTLARAKEAKIWGKYKAVLWHQGEFNRFDFQNIAYVSRLKKIIDTLRVELENDSLMLIVGEIGHWWDANVPFNNMISTVGNDMNYTYCASAKDLINITNLADNDAHFNRDGLEILGQRYADIALKHLYHIDFTNTPGINYDPENCIVTHKGNILSVKCREVTDCYVSDLSGRLIHVSEIHDVEDINLSPKGIYLVCLNNNCESKKMKVLVN